MPASRLIAAAPLTVLLAAGTLAGPEVEAKTPAVHPAATAEAAATDPTPAVAAPAPELAATPVLDPTLVPLRAGSPATLRGDGRAPFAVEVDGRPVRWEVLALPVLPGETVSVEVGPAAAHGSRLRHAAGIAVPGEGPGRWTWTAPAEPGIVAVRVEGRDGSALTLHLLVLHGRDRIVGDRLGTYEIGRYREEPLRGLPQYLPPRGFVQVASADRDVLVSPHFTLGQFLCKQPGEPSFIAYSLPLITKLEVVLEEVRAEGWAAPTLHVMSGFRTPAYNRAIGNTTSYSRHLWGDAADVWVDVDGDGRMDDLDRDGRSGLGDARALAAIVDRVEARAGEIDVLPGGVGSYRANAVRGPFVHVDARGYTARW